MIGCRVAADLRALVLHDTGGAPRKDVQEGVIQAHRSYLSTYLDPKRI